MSVCYAFVQNLEAPEQCGSTWGFAVSSPASALLQGIWSSLSQCGWGHCLLVLLGNVSEYCICWGAAGEGAWYLQKKKKKQLWLIYYFVAMGLSVNSSRAP